MALRDEVAKFLSNLQSGVDEGDGKPGKHVIDPFNQPNEWEEERRKESRKPKAAGAADLDSHRGPRPKSRRAQQALKEAAKKALATEEDGDAIQVAGSKKSANGDFAKPSKAAGAQGVQGAASGGAEPIRGKASTRLVLPLCTNWWDELVAVPTDESGGVAGGAMDEGAMARARGEAEALYARELEAFAAAQAPIHTLIFTEHGGGELDLLEE